MNDESKMDKCGICGQNLFIDLDRSKLCMSCGEVKEDPTEGRNWSGRIHAHTVSQRGMDGRKTKMENQNKPIKKFATGAISVAVFENSGKNGEKYPSVVLQRTYKQGNEWKRTHSLKESDLPKACMLLNKAYEFLASKEEAESPA